MPKTERYEDQIDGTKHVLISIYVLVVKLYYYGSMVISLLRQVKHSLLE